MSDGAKESAMNFFSENVDAWGACEWFDRMAKAIREQDKAVLAKNDIAFETCKNVAASSAMRLVREYEQEVRSALRATHPSAPMTADIAQIISQGYASGKTAAEIAEEVAREFDRDAPAQSNGDDGWKCLAPAKAACAWPDCGCDPAATKVIAALVDAGWLGAEEAESLRSQLATAQATYLQFCKKHDERKENIRNETIELCAKIAENNGWEATAAQIRDLKEIT